MGNDTVYEKIVRRELNKLEWVHKKRLNHGDSYLCPSCGAPGAFDIKTEFSITHTTPIFWSTLFNTWKCLKCIKEIKVYG